MKAIKSSNSNENNRCIKRLKYQSFKTLLLNICRFFTSNFISTCKTRESIALNGKNQQKLLKAKMCLNIL